MSVQEQINKYITAQPSSKKDDMEIVHQLILKLLPGCKLWYLDGLDASGKVVSNPNIGYGQYTISYADGKKKEFYRIGLSANSSGISVYIMGIADRKYLPAAFGSKIGKASVTGYCIKFRALKDIKTDVLKEAILFGVSQK